MFSKKIKHTIIIILSIISIGGNILLLLSNGLFEFNRFREKYIENKSQKPLSNIADFENALFRGGLNIIESGKKPFTPKKMGGVIDNLYYNFKGYPKAELYKTSEMGYLMIATLEKAIISKDKENLNKIKEIFDKYILKSDLEIVDQCLYGIVAIYLYKETKEIKYSEYANFMALWLKNSYIPNVGILYRKGANCNLVDGLGMYIPFLVEYSHFSNHLEYEALAIDCFENFAKDGVDPSTGIAFHGYKIDEPKIKMGSANWGRGNAWMALAIAYLPNNKLSDDGKKVCDTFQKTMLKIYNSQDEIRQFIIEGKLDLSATIPILYLLEKNRFIKINKLSYSRYMRGDILYFSSGPTTECNDYSPYRGPNMLSQAIMLKWLLE